MKLTAKQTAFIGEYSKDWNATQAAIRAGYSKRTAHVIGQENLRKPAIRDAIASYAPTKHEVLGRIAIFARGEHERAEPYHELKALEVLAKIYGLLDKKIVINQLPPPTYEYGNGPDEL